MSDTPPTLMLIDGNSLTYRAFFALPTDMATASGQVTNAVFGFTSMLINLLRDHPHDGLAVAFDRPEPTFRHERVETYKANRSAAPDILRQQMGLVRQVIDTLEIPTLEQAGVEADDIIATLATRARDDGRHVIIVTGDRDSYQLVEDPPSRSSTTGGACPTTRSTTRPGIEERTGVHPTRYVAVRRAARRPVRQPARRAGRRGEDGGQAHQQVRRARRHLRPPRRADPEAPPEPGRARGPGPRERRGDGAAARRRARRRDRRPRDGRLRRRGGPQPLRRSSSSARSTTGWPRRSRPTSVPTAASEVEVLEAEVTPVTEPAEAVAAARAPGARATGPLAVEAAYAGVPYWCADLARAGPRGRRRRPPRWRGCRSRSSTTPKVRDALAALLRPGRPPAGRPRRQAAARLAAAHRPARGRARHRHVDRRLPDRPGRLRLPAPEPAAEVRLARAAVRRHRPRRPARLRRRRRRPTSASRPAGGRSPWATSRRGCSTRSTSRACAACTTTSRPRWSACSPAWRWSASASTPSTCASCTTRSRSRCDELQQQIWDDAGEEFVVNSTPQLRTILYEKLGLTPQKRTKTGYSTDAQTLQKLEGQHPIIEHLLAYREVEKLRSTYGEGLLAEVARRRPHPRHLQPDGGPHRPAQLRRAEPAQHPGPQRPGPHLPGRLRAGEGLQAPRGRLQPDRAALHRPPRRGPGPRRRVHRRRGHPHRHRGTGVQGRAGRRHAGPAGQVEDGQLRPRLRHGVLRARPAAQHRGGGGVGDPQGVLRGVPVGEAVHGPHRVRGPRARLHRDALRSPPADPRAVGQQRAHPPGRASARP